MKNKKYIQYIISVFLWLIIWHVGAEAISDELFLPSPERVFSVLFSELFSSDIFLKSIFTSMTHICTGFLTGCIAGILLAVLSHIFQAARVFLWVPIRVIQAVPVASFVILVLLWITTDMLSVVIPFLMVLPILYNTTLVALDTCDEKINEMAKVFKVSVLKKIIYIYIPQIISAVLSSASMAMGMAWKSGVAAEVIGLAYGTIGNQMYQAKIYLQTPELFAWTIVIVFLSVMCEQLIRLISKVWKRGYHG